MGVADSALSPCDGDREYTIVDCESSITALDMVQLPLDKQGSLHTITVLILGICAICRMHCAISESYLRNRLYMHVHVDAYTCGHKIIERLWLHVVRGPVTLKSVPKKLVPLVIKPVPLIAPQVILPFSFSLKLRPLSPSGWERPVDTLSRMVSG